MRFSDRINIITDIKGGYDPVEGVHKPPIKFSETLPCMLSNLNKEAVVTLFGEMSRDIKTAILQQPYEKEFSHVEIDGKKYKVVDQERGRRKHVLYLEGGSL